MKILLVNLPWQKQGRWGVRAGSRWPHIKDESEGDYLPFPFFLSYATSLLQKHNIDAVMIDGIAEQIPEGDFLGRITRINFDYLVTETSIPSFYDDLSILRKISSLKIPIILCGPNFEIYHTRFLEVNSFIDFVLYGEYEYTLLELIKCLQSGGDLSSIKGLIYRDNGAVIKNPKREPFDINALPWPFRDGLPMNKYLDAPGEMFTPSVQMQASRGCPFKCHFCLWPQVVYQGNCYRTRDVKDVADEMEYLVKEKGFKSVYFDDDTFNIYKTRMLNFCQEIKKRGMNKVQWAIMARPDLMDEEILVNMKEAGLWAVKYGVESATQSLVDSIGKNMDLEKSERMIEFTKRLRIRTHLTFTFGLPGETKQTIEKTISYAKKLNPFSTQFSITTPFPGTRYYEVLEKKGFIVSKDLSHYDGHSRSVIKSENLTPEDLEIAKNRAIKIWAEHLRKGRKFKDNLNKFHYYAKNKGPFYATGKTISYLRGLFLEKTRPIIDENLLNKLKKLKNILSEKRRGFETNLRKFHYYTKNNNLLYGTYKTINYFKKVFLIKMRKPRAIRKKSHKDYRRGSERADILLIECPPWCIMMPPLGIAYLSSYLRKHGYKTSVYDLNAALHNSAPREAKYLWEQKSFDWWVDDKLFKKTLSYIWEDTISHIKNILNRVKTEYIGLSVNFSGINYTRELLKVIKQIKTKSRIIIGGWGCVNDHMRGLFPRELVDVFAVGEGERTLLEAIEALRGRRNMDNIPGAIFNNGSNPGYKPRAPIMELDSIPWPTYEEFDLSCYTQPILPLFASRGCIGNCSFCNDWPLSKPYRFRSARNVFDEIKYHVENNGINTFSFKDLLCNGNIRELNSLCDLIIESGLKIHWDSQAIPRKEVTYGLLCKLKKSGCGTLIYGIESFSNNVLRGMRKLFTRDIAERVLADTDKAKISSIVNIIVGFPGETEEDFNETYQAIKRNAKYITQIGALSVCLVNNDNDIDINPENYGVVLLDDPKIRAKKWHSVDGKNTYELRKERAEKIIKLLEELDLTYATKMI